MLADSLTTRVTNYIFDHIRVNQLSSGECLPSELKTSTDLNISRGIVREAFRSLEVAGIIEKGNGRSPKVGVMNSDFLTHLMVHSILTRQVSIRQVLELRASIEITAAGHAARRRTRSEVQRLRAVVQGMKESLSNFDFFVEHDLDFHQVINGATGNPLIQVVCSAMHESVKESMQVGLRKRKGQEEIMKVVEAHEAIVDAIEQGNATQAEARMKKHFDETLRVFGRLDLD